MNIYLSENTRLNKSDFNVTIQNLKIVEVKDKNGVVKNLTPTWVTVPNFFTSSIERAIKKSVDLELCDFEFEKFEDYTEKTEELLKKILEKIEVKED